MDLLLYWTDFISMCFKNHTAPISGPADTSVSVPTSDAAPNFDPAPASNSAPTSDPATT